MKSKTLIYIPVSILTLIFLAVLHSLINEDSQKVEFQCSHTLMIDMKKNAEFVKFRTNTKYIYFNNGTAVKSDVGTMSVDDKVYVIYRNYISDYRLDGKTVSFTVKEVHKASKDNAPKNESLLQTNKDIVYHMTISKLHGGAYLLKTQGLPIAVCT
ncbi:hypothetical protein [Serratia ureilytica]|uniref:hypothetical protein n=1 Tax=Serratia ureilytica TaxID=300181 RepID=UPI001C103933|nr:hypothetical protein [Serratia ureilytica]MBU5412434.1 hypothetical protein [Serratia ureilytica]